jgi:Zn-dependent peptidase ImmA (M78 family)
MLFTSGNSPHLSITSKVYDFFTESYEIDSDVEIYHKDLSDENAFGFTEVNGKEQFIQIHNDLNEEDYVTTVLHELVHVVQNEQGITSDNVREDQAYHMEKVLFKKWCDSLQGVHYSPTDSQNRVY